MQQALNLLTTQVKTPLTEYTLSCEYGQLAGVEMLVEQHVGQVVTSDYQAAVQLRVALPQAKVADFSARLADLVVVHCNC